MYDPLHAMLVHSIASRLSEKGRRWPFKMGALEIGRQLNTLSDERLQDLSFAAEKDDPGYFRAKLKEAGVE